MLGSVESVEGVCRERNASKVVEDGGLELGGANDPGLDAAGTSLLACYFALGQKRNVVAEPAVAEALHVSKNAGGKLAFVEQSGGGGDEASVNPGAGKASSC